MKRGLTAWKRVYYSQPAIKVKQKDALRHSLRKWKGLLDLKRFGLKLVGRFVIDSNNTAISFCFDTTTCALCFHYLKPETTRCNECPLAKVRGLVSCDTTMPAEAQSPFCALYERQDPRPMIAWLELTARLFEEIPNAKRR